MNWQSKLGRRITDVIFLRMLNSIAHKRHPDFVIGDPNEPYLRRWYVIPRNPLFNIYLHQILRSDDDRALHCHPWLNISYLLFGSYIERLPARQRQQPAMDYRPGCTRNVQRTAGTRSGITCRTGRMRHRLIIPDGATPCWTLFITGPAYRRWGFWCAHGWRYWKDYVNPDNRGTTGRGCGA